MIYYKYYLEIKNRFVLICLAGSLCLSVTYYYKEILLFMFIHLSQFTNDIGSSFYFIFTDVTEIFSVYFQLIFFITSQIMLISSIYHFLVFIAPGLYQLEYNRLNFLIKFFFITWFISIFFFNFVFLPLSWEFFISFQNQTIVKTFDLFFEAKINEYLNYYISAYYVCLVNCQFITFIIAFIFSFDSNIQTVRNFRRFFYFFFVVFSTFITPPDIISQIVLSLSLIIFYEGLIFVKFLVKINKATN